MKTPSPAMLRIRAAQMHVLSEAAMARFVDALVQALMSEQAQRAQSLGADGVRDWVLHGVARAASYDITGDAAVGRYVRLMFVFGRDFDQHPDHPWVHQHLTTPHADQDTRMNALTAACHDFVLRMSARRDEA